jgi:hypothetical protein
MTGWLLAECHIYLGSFAPTLLVLVELLQVVRRHGIYTAVLSTINIVLVAKDL